jgi:hypothetical protein
MPSREYYLDNDIYKEAYLRYMISVAKLLGAEDSFARSEMTNVLNFEIQLANVSIVIQGYSWGKIGWAIWPILRNLCGHGQQYDNKYMVKKLIKSPNKL